LIQWFDDTKRSQVWKETLWDKFVETVQNFVAWRGNHPDEETHV